MPTTALYQLAQKFLELAPWKSWEETDLLKIIHPVTNEVAYISIMGQIEQHRAMALYLGDSAIARYYTMLGDDPHDSYHHEDDTQSLIMETRQLQLSFGTRKELQPDQIKKIKQLGFNFRGNNWPIFRSYEAGYGPGDLNEEEISWLTIALEQFMALFNAHAEEVPSVFRENGEVLEILTLLHREGRWTQEWQFHDDSEHEWSTPEPSGFLVAKIQQNKPALDIECHFFHLPALIGDWRKPKLGYIAISADSKSGMLLGADILSIENQSYEQMIDSVPNTFLQQWIKAGVRPASLRVKSITCFSLLEITAADLDVTIQRCDRLPALDRAIQHLPF